MVLADARGVSAWMLVLASLRADEAALLTIARDLVGPRLGAGASACGGAPPRAGAARTSRQRPPDGSEDSAVQWLIHKPKDAPYRVAAPDLRSPVCLDLGRRRGLGVPPSTKSLSRFGRPTEQVGSIAPGG
jgi:hypothetical protein